MKNSALVLLGLLPLVAACTAETAPPAPDGEGAHGAVASAVMTNGGRIPCHFTTAGCAGEGPDGFAQDPANQGANGGGGGGYAVPPADPGGAQAFTRCASQCASSNLGVSQGYGACNAACLATGARFVHHLPGVGFVGDGTPADPSNYGSCISGCAGLESLCVDACATGGMF